MTTTTAPLDLPRRVSDLPLRWSAETPDAIAYDTRSGRFTWGEVGAAITRTAARLTALGVRPGDRVMVISENGIGTVVLFFAITHLDAWASIVNARMSEREIATMRDFAGVRTVIYAVDDSPAAARHAAALADLQSIEDPLFGRALATPADAASIAEPVHASNDQIAVLTFTSGTTGAPKAVMLSHRAVSYTAYSQCLSRHLTPADGIYIVSPLSHSIGLSSNLLAAAMAGAKAILATGFDPAHMTRSILDGDTTFLVAVPQLFSRLLDYAEAQQIDLHQGHVRALACGGAALDPTLKQRIQAAFGVAIGNGYGATEMVPVCRVPDGVDVEANVVGVAQPGVEIRLVGNDGTDAADGETGEIWVRGPSLMSGYYRNPQATAEVMRPGGWLATGDLGQRDADGHYRIVGRLKELIIRSGFNVYPIEVESVLGSHPAVGQSAVVGRDVPGNEEVVAFVQLLPGRQATAEELTTYLRDQLAPYKIPVEIRIGELPIGPTGKIMKSALKREAQNTPLAS